MTAESFCELQTVSGKIKFHLYTQPFQQNALVMVSSLATFGANAGSSAALVRVKWRRGNGRECLTLMETWSHLLTTIFLQPN